MRKVEILKIGSIIPSIKSDDKCTIMIVYNGGPIFDHYVSILREKCGDEYKYLKTDQSIVGGVLRPSYSIPGRLSKYYQVLKGIQNDEPEVGKSYSVEHWHTSIVMKIIDEDILITKNSVYAIHDVSKIRDRKLNDLGI